MLGSVLGTSWVTIFVHNSFKTKDGSTRCTHIKRKGNFNNSINGGGEKMYTADQMCNMVDVLADNIFVKFEGGVYFIKLLERIYIYI